MKSSITALVGFLALAATVAGHALGLEASVAIAGILALVFGLGWPHYLAIPAKKTLGVIIALTGVASVLTAGATADHDFLVWSPLFIAVGFGSVLAVQVIRGTGQRHRLESTLGAGAGVAIAGLGGGWVASYRLLEHADMTMIVAISATVALAVGLLRWPDRVVAPLAIGLAALAGPLAALLLTEVPLLPAALLGALVAAILASFRRLRTLAGAAPGWFGAVAAGLAPWVALGALVYFVEKLLHV